jgi:uncharacterized protein YrrD
VPFKEGADVIGAEGEQVGLIEKILVDEATHRATHFVVASQAMFHGGKLVPASWLKAVEEVQVHLSVPSQLLERLPDYQA